MEDGMMSPQSQPEQTEQQSAGYNGVITVNGDEVDVKGGIGVYQDDKFFVSDDGSMVLDEERNLLGRIENGTFVEVDEAQMEAMQQDGRLE